jgi:hypothetical protein
MKNITPSFFVRCLILLLVTSCSVVAQKSAADVIQKRVTLKMERQPLGVIFRVLMERYDVAIGFEESSLDRSHNEYDFDTNLPGTGKERIEIGDRDLKIDVETWRVFKAEKHPLSINVSNVRLKDVFDILVRQLRNYKWEVSDNVVDIFPIKGRDKRYKRLLELRIGSFASKKGDSIRALTSEIYALPEVRGYLNENQLYFSLNRPGSALLLNSQYGRKLDVEMNFANLTLKELLNRITQAKRGGWILKKSNIFGTPGKEYIDIDI